MCSKINIESIIEEEGFYLFTGSGNSMWPLIREGVDTVEVGPASAGPVPGDVILFRKEERYVLHRVIKVEGGLITARGDNNRGCESVPADAVAGVMTGLWRGERKVSLTSLRYRIYKYLCLRGSRLARLGAKLLWK